MIRAALRDPVVAGIGAGLLLAGIEAMALIADAATLALVAVAAALCILAGALVGLAIAAGLGVCLRFRLAGPVRGLVVAAPSVVPVAWLATSLFEGSLAATLPGASSAWLWMPAIVWLGLAGAIWLGTSLTHRGRWLVVAAALVVFVVAEAGNRLLFRSGYPDVHLVLIVVALAALVALALLLGGVGFARPRIAAAGLLIAVALGGAGIAFGLGDPRARADLTSKGNHVRHLVRFVRGLSDSDGDGYSWLLGGGDCDDRDPRRNPGAPDVPANGVDEDCDGKDGATVVVSPKSRSRAEAYRAWLASEKTRAMLARTAKMNVLIISIDTLRADYGFVGPALERLRKRSVSFERAFSPAAGTDLSMATFVTGRIDPFVRLDTTVIEAIADSGRKTFALWPREVLRYAGATLLTRGLDDYATIVNDKAQRDVGSTTTSVETTTRAITELRKQASAEQPFFLWVHYFDVHEHLQVESADRDLKSIGGDLDSLKGKYEALVRLTDREIGRLLEGLDESGQREQTIVIMFSDHGESLGEDPRLPDNHGLVVYQPLVAIPLLVSVPGVPAARVQVPTSLADLSVTLLALLGLERTAEQVGDDLTVYLDPDRAPELNERNSPIVLNESDQWGIVEWPYKLMVRPADNLVELYDLSTDPKEKQNLADSDASRVARLKSLYAGFPRPNLDRTRKARKKREQLAQPPESRRK